VLPEFLPFLMMGDKFMKRAVEISVGSLSPTINWKTMKLEKFPLPPLDQQRRIAEILWALNKVAECWIHSLNMARQANAACGAAAFHGVSVVESGNSVRTLRLGDAFKVRTGGTPSRANPSYWGGEVPWIKTGEVNYRDIYDSEEKISELGYQNSAAKLIPGNSVLMALYGQGPTLGRVAHLRVEAAVNQACAAILPNPDFNMRFLYHYLAGQYVEVRRLARGASQPNINALIVKDFIVPAPPLLEQDAIAVELDRHLKTQERIIDCIAMNRNLLVTLINALT
jgi:type I restriction enzyme S subunit